MNLLATCNFEPNWGNRRGKQLIEQKKKRRVINGASQQERGIHNLSDKCKFTGSKTFLLFFSSFLFPHSSTPRRNFVYPSSWTNDNVVITSSPMGSSFCWSTLDEARDKRGKQYKKTFQQPTCYRSFHDHSTTQLNNCVMFVMCFYLSHSFGMLASHGPHTRSHNLDVILLPSRRSFIYC